MTEPTFGGGIMAEPTFGGPALLMPGDAIATTRDVGPNQWEPATFIGYVTARPVKHRNIYAVYVDSGLFPIRATQTLAIWFGARSVG